MKNGILHTLACIGLTLGLSFALSNPVLANEDNILTWDAFSPTDQVNVETVQIERKIGECAASVPWVQIGEVNGTLTTYTDVNLAPGPYCYRAFSWNTSIGRSPASNLAVKTVPFGIPGAPANLVVQ